MSNYNGFTLIEVMTALMVLIVTTLVLVPTISHVYMEKISIQQEREGIYLLDKAITNWIYEGKDISLLEVESRGTIYQFFSRYKEESQEFKVCVAWLGSNNRRYERCGTAKR